MLYPIMLFCFAGLVGTLLALRLMAIEAQEQRTSLTRRGRVVVAFCVGIGVALFVVAVNGMWWNCDLHNQCSFAWGY